MRASLAIVLVAFSAAVPAQQLGTLFHTAKERESMEKLRRGEPVEQALILGPDPVITGYVKRSDGKSTVFVDKQAFPVRSQEVQGQLQPGIVERFSPMPLPPASPPPASREDKEPAQKPATPRKRPAASRKPGEEE